MGPRPQGSPRMRASQAVNSPKAGFRPAALRRQGDVEPRPPNRRNLTVAGPSVDDARAAQALLTRDHRPSGTPRATAKSISARTGPPK